MFVKVDKVKTRKVLLNGVSGAAPSGRLVALMGATGGEYRLFLTVQVTIAVTVALRIASVPSQH